MSYESLTIKVDEYLDWFESPVDDRGVLGGKGASLARMAGHLGLPVPPGFTITTAAWKEFARDGAEVPLELKEALGDRLTELAARLDRGVDDPARPLLLSVRSGAPVSMPGMMDTVLNVGLNDGIVEALAERTSERFAYQSYLRLLASFAEIVREIPNDALKELQAADEEGNETALIGRWKALIEEQGEPFPTTLAEQVRESIEAVWRSWNRPRAQRYRKFRGIPEDLGTAVTVQAMVFGNLDDQSGTGVVFTRDPGTGEAVLYGDFMPCAQGEDVVNGSIIPEPVQQLSTRSAELWNTLQNACSVLETDFADMCDIEFTVQHGAFYLLQARAGQRSPAASVRIAVDMVREGLIDESTALDRVSLGALQRLQAPVAIDLDELHVIGRGVAASPGTGVGPAVFDSARAEEFVASGTQPVLLCPTTSPEDINGMIASSAIATGLGGRASHAAVVARGMGKPAVCGIEEMSIDEAGARAVFASGEVLTEGDVVTVDGTSGRLFAGEAKFQDAVADSWVEELLLWCRGRNQLPILSAAPRDAVSVAGADDELPAGAAAVVVAVDWEGSDSSANLTRTCEYVFSSLDAGSTVYLALPDDLAGIDFRPPAGPWAGVIASPGNDWAANLLAARLSEAATPESGA